MFTIEHEFDSTVITLVDEGQVPLQEDVVVNGFEECITVEQYDTRLNQIQKITLSIAQMRDLGAAISLPEGVYSRSDAMPSGALTSDTQSSDTQS